MRPEEPNPGLDRVRFQLRADGVPAETPNQLRSGIHNRGYLPHVKREGASYFVTFRLADSLPKEVLLRFLGEKAERLRALEMRKANGPTKAQARQTQDTTEEIERDYRRKVERYLDQGAGACHLRRSDIAEMISGALRHFHSKQYLLDDWVIMPNHVHLILWPMPNFTLSEILKSRKQFTATQANRILGRTGVFWQAESFDHWIRDDAEKSRIRRYIRGNPVKAGLCAQPEDWRWGGAWREAES
jgi:REP element-mobilizing transposase RayT